MQPTSVPPVLRDRLGDEATLVLFEVLESSHREWRDEVLVIAADRFERRLSEEMGALRVEMAKEFAAVRREMAEGFAGIRVESIKWSFLFWIGQVAAVGGLMAILLKTVR